AANRAGSPFALMISASHCGAKRSIARSRIVRPAIVRSGLSPPPIRRASPPARSTPRAAETSLITSAFAAVLCTLFLHVGEVLVEDDAVLARQGEEALAAGAADERQANLPGELDAPGREARARDQDRDAHPNGLQHHLGGEAP